MTKPKVVIGLPSLNEGRTIRKLSEDLGRAFASSELSQIGYNTKNVHVVNADCGSTDGTPLCFLSGDTPLFQESMTVERGKGNAIKAIMEYTVQTDSEGLLLVDSDLPHVPSEWLVKFLSEARNGRDLVFPRRPPVWNGGDLSYHGCTPVLSSFWGSLMHEPICGDVFISNKLARCILADMPNALQQGVRGYGIDFFISMHGSKFDWQEVYMVNTKGNPLRSFSPSVFSKVTMGNKFLEVFGTMGDCIRRLPLDQEKTVNHSELKINESGKREWIDGAVPPLNQELEDIASSLSVDLNAVQGVFNAAQMEMLSKDLVSLNSRGLPFSTWLDIIPQLLINIDYSSFDNPATRAAEQIFLSRVVGHYQEIKGKPQWYHTLEEQAARAFEKRADLITSLQQNIQPIFSEHSLNEFQRTNGLSCAQDNVKLNSSLTP